MTRTVTVFRVLPRATNEAPILPCPRPSPHLYNNISFFILLTPLISPLPHRVRLSTVCSEHPSRSSLLTPPHPSPEAHQCNISPFRRAQNSSHVRIRPPQLILAHPHFLFRQLPLPFCAISPFAFASPSISFSSLSAPNLRPELEPSKKKKIPLIPFIHYGC